MCDDVYLINGRYGSCTGCDSCMQAWADAGLINYNVKHKGQETVTADVELTSKGRKYLLSEMNGKVAEYAEQGYGDYSFIDEAMEQGFELMVTAYEEPVSSRVIYELCDERYLCEVDERVNMTPFLTALGADGQQTHTTRYDVIYREVDGERQLEYRTGGLWYDIEHEGVDISEGSIGDALMVRFGIHPKMGYQLLNDFTTRKWHFSMTESSRDVKGTGEPWQYEDWNMNEVFYKVKSTGDDGKVYYGKCPYLQVGDTVYFPILGLWSESEDALKKAKYSVGPQYGVECTYPLSIF